MPTTCEGVRALRGLQAAAGTRRSAHRRLHGLDGVVLVVDGRGGAGHVVDLVDLNEELLGDVVPDDLKVGLVKQVLDVGLLRGEEVVERDHIVPLVDQPSAQVASEEAAPARDQDSEEWVLFLTVS